MPPVRLQSEPLDPSAAWPGKVTPATGAVTLYVGTVRGDDDGHPVEALHVEAYREMAESELERLCDQTVERFDLEDVRIVHRTGRVEAGEPIIVVAVHGSHRKETFAAVDHVLDEIKRRIPIWKKETGPEGRWILGTTDEEVLA